MSDLKKNDIINIALVGGGNYCEEVLEKTSQDYKSTDVNARFVAVADPDPQSPGIVLARKLGLLTLDDYHQLYDPAYDIHLIILMTPKQEILEDILSTKPHHIRVQSYHVFEVFWKAISLEEQKLRIRNKEIETILNGIQELIAVITPEKEIIDVNDAFLRQMRCSREEVIGKKCYEVFQNLKEICDGRKFTCPLNEVIRNKGPFRQVMTRVGSDGQPRYFEVNIYPTWERKGKISKFIDISRDITKRLREEEEMTRRLEQLVEERTRQLKETHAKLIHQDKIASLGKLSAAVVHEINNPVAGVLNLILLMKRILEKGPIEASDIDLFREYLDLMETETRRTSRIVSNLLTFARQSKMEFGPVDINRLIDQTLILNTNLLKLNNIKIDKILDPRLPEFTGSSDQLQQVFMNIVSNAAEAMEPKGGGTLRIETMFPREKEKIIVRFCDTGIGIPKEDMEKLFEPFFTKKTKGKGVGLGLSVAYGIIQEHGGSISVKSTPGEGTSFEIELPLNKRIVQD
ncbi:MAG: PAS domain-containing protein [Deltaproteobacteria bacterium]|nr:PAS domain-containing protein [Deltaproteobacteria bacterium]